MQNFGKIKNAFNELVSEGIATKDVASQKLFKKYIKAIRENEIIRTQFLVVTNLENKVESNREIAIDYVKENIAIFSSFNKKKIMEANNNLSSFIRLCKKGELLKEDFVYEQKDLHEHVAKLIFTKKTPNSIDSIIESTNYLVNHILNNKTKEIVEKIELPNSMISTIMVDKYNEKYSDLTESEKEILKVLIDSTDAEKKEVYSKTIRECLDLINEKLSDCDLDSKDKLLRVKDKLLNDKIEINENFSVNISKLVALKSSLIDG